MTDPEQFEADKRAEIAMMANDTSFRELSRAWFDASCRHRYSYHFTWLGLPVIQYPQDLVALQEIIWRTRPETIVETGVARGGSVVFFASMLELLGRGQVIGIDIEIRPHNRAAIAGHPLAERVRLIEGSSTDPAIAREVHRAVGKDRPAMVVLDSGHSHEHVIEELRLYSSLVRRGGYLVVLDTVVEDLPAELFPAKAWGPGNNPRTAVQAFLSENPRFQVDAEIEAKLALTVAPGGYLRCVRDPQP